MSKQEFTLLLSGSLVCLVLAGCGRGLGTSGVMTQVNGTPNASAPNGNLGSPSNPTSNPAPSPTPTPVSSPSAEYLYFGNALYHEFGSDSPKYVGFPLDLSNGNIGPAQVPGSPYSNLSPNFPGPSAVSGKFLYAIEGWTGRPGPVDIMAFQITSSDGSLEPIPGANPFWPGSPDNQPTDVIAGPGLQVLAGDPLGRFLFGASGNCCGIDVYRIGSAGLLSEAWSLPTRQDPTPEYAIAGLAIDPSGSFLYGISSVNGSIFGYRVESDGSLTPVPNSAFAAGLPPDQACTCLTIDPAGKFLYAVSPALNGATPSNSIYAFTIDGRTGALNPIHGSPFSTDQFPISIAITPSGRYLYVANQLSQNITGYAVQADGSLTPLSGSPFHESGVQITVDPSGRFVYLGNGGGGVPVSISVLSIDSATGFLNPTGDQIPGGLGFSIAAPK